jgi:hypothetical protein
LGRLHGEVAEDLEEVILDHIANCTRHIVKSTSALDPKILRHGDLDGFNVFPVPNRLKQGVDKSEKYQVVDRPFAKVVVDSIHGALRKFGEQEFI